MTKDEALAWVKRQTGDDQTLDVRKMDEVYKILVGFGTFDKRHEARIAFRWAKLQEKAGIAPTK